MQRTVGNARTVILCLCAIGIGAVAAADNCFPLPIFGPSTPCVTVFLPCSLTLPEDYAQAARLAQPSRTAQAGCELLNCSRRALETLPCSLSPLLTWADLSHNSIRTPVGPAFFASLSRLENLRLLDLSYNAIPAVNASSSSSSTTFLFSLALDFSHNPNLTAVALPQLGVNSVDLSATGIATLPAHAFWKASIASYLAFADATRLTSIAPYAFEEASIGALFFTNAPLVSLGSLAFASLQVGTLEFTGGRLEEIQAQAFYDANIIGGGLLLAGNRIAAVDPLAFEKTVLAGAAGTQSRLDLSSNALGDISGGWFTAEDGIVASNLFVDLRFNRISLTGGEFSESTAILAQVDLRSNAMSVLAGTPFTGAIIHNLLLDDNDLTELPTNSFYGLTSTLVTLSNNTIALIASQAFAGASITTLDLSAQRPAVSGPMAIENAAFSGLSLNNLFLQDNTLTQLTGTMFSNLNINGNISFANNAIRTLNQVWFSAFPLEVSLDMASNPSVCTVALYRGIRCACAAGTLGTGQFCGISPCDPAELAPPAHGHFDCGSTAVASGEQCDLVCDAGYDVLGAPATCLGGIFGQLPDSDSLPICIPASTTSSKLSATDVLIIVFGTLGAQAVIAGVAVLVVRYKKLRRKFHTTTETLDLKERLLQEKSEQLETLESLFLIDAQDVAFERRLDEATPGAFGEVWLGRWHDTPVAIKKLRVMLLMLDEESVQEFNREVEFMRTMRHANLVLFYGAGLIQDASAEMMVPFLVTELMGTSLQSFIADAADKGSDGFPWPLRRKFALDAARGMAYIHSLGRLHRDLKSANLLISTSGTTAKVADFGTAVLLSRIRDDLDDVDSSMDGDRGDPHRRRRWRVRRRWRTRASSKLQETAIDVPPPALSTNSSAVSAASAASVGSSASTTASTSTSLAATDPLYQSMASRTSANSSASSQLQMSFGLTTHTGTPSYMAPELLGGRRYGMPADVYSFAIVMWELASLKLPWMDLELKNNSVIHVLCKVVDEQNQRPPIPSATPKAFADLMERCWARDPRMRSLFQQIVDMPALT